MNIRIHPLMFVALFTLNALSGNNNERLTTEIQENARLANQHGFIPNNGQIADSNGEPATNVLFKSTAPGLDMYITTSGISYYFYKYKPEAQTKKDSLFPGMEPPQTSFEYEWSRFDMQLKGVSIKKENVVYENPSEAVFNYYLGHCGEGVLNVQKYKKVTVRNIYNNIDWVLYYTAAGDLKYDFVVHPGANAAHLVMEYLGDANLQANNTNITIHNTLGKVSEGELYCYEKGTRTAINATYKLNTANKKNIVSFVLDAYNKKETLVIDPPLTWATYYGENAGDFFYGSTVDAADNLYIVGTTHNPNFPLQNLPGAYNNNVYNTTGVFTTAADGYMLKFNALGVLQWATFIGGSGGESATAVVVDGNNNLYVAGLSTTPSGATFPIVNVPGAYSQPMYAGGFSDLFISKFDPAGVMVWSTYYGGIAQDDAPRVMITDAANNVYLCGSTFSNNFPTQNLPGAYNQASLGANNLNDGYIVKFDAANSLVWASYFGGDEADGITDLAIDASGNLYATAFSRSANFSPIVSGTGYYRGTKGISLVDGVILKFNTALACVWGTYYGGSTTGALGNIIWAMDIDASGNVYVVGLTDATDVPVLAPAGPAAHCAYAEPYGGGIGDAFISMFNAAQTLVWSTYIGGDGLEQAMDVLCDAANNVYVLGNTTSSDFPVKSLTGSYYQPTHANIAENDVFITQFTSNHFLNWSTYYGGTLSDNSYANSLQYSNTGELYVMYTSTSANVPTQPLGGAYYQPGNAGMNDVVINRFSPSQVIPSYSVTLGSTDVLCFGGSTGTAIANPSNGTGPYTYLWLPSGGTTQSATGLLAGTYNLVVTDANCIQVNETVIITEPPPVLVNPISTGVCEGESITLTASANGGNGTYNYSWNSGASTGSTVRVSPTTPTIYTVTATDGNGCESAVETYTVDVKPAPIAYAGEDTTICSGETVALFASGGTLYTWNAVVGISDIGIPDPILTPPQTTTCIVNVSNGFCSDNDTLVVNVDASPIAVVGTSATITIGASVSLSASGGAFYTWTPARGLSCDTCANPIATPQQTTTYYVLVTNDSGCSDLDSVTIVVDLSCGEIFVPNVFSPNADGQNDLLGIYNPCLISGSYVIYDRWGNTIFETNDIFQKWDGSYKGKIMDTDVFVYSLVATLLNGAEVTKTGNVSLVK